MSFQHYAPCAALRPYVRALAVQTAADAQLYRVLPTPGLVLGFQYRGQLACQIEGRRAALAPAGITGICDQYRLFASEPQTATVLVLFRVGGAAPFFRLPLHELFRQSVGLDCLLPPSEVARLQDALGTAPTDGERVQVVQRFLLARYCPARPNRLVLGALAALHQSGGALRMAALARQLGTSSSPLEKRFRQAVGASPKKIATILQFTHALSQHQPGQSLTELAYRTGFYDQAHFIHAFRAFTGQAPGDFFAPDPAAIAEPGDSATPLRRPAGTKKPGT